MLQLLTCSYSNWPLTTASQSGGWVPHTSRSFNYWQPAPRWRPLPWLTNPGNPAMSPYVEGGKQAPITLIKQWKEREGQGKGDSLQGVPTLRRNANAQKMLTQNTNKPLQCPKKQEHEESWHMLIFNKPLTAQVKLVLLVVNSIKLHLTALWSLKNWTKLYIWFSLFGKSALQIL